MMWCDVTLPTTTTTTHLPYPALTLPYLTIHPEKNTPHQSPTHLRWEVNRWHGARTIDETSTAANLRGNYQLWQRDRWWCWDIEHWGCGIEGMKRWKKGKETIKSGLGLGSGVGARRHVNSRQCKILIYYLILIYFTIIMSGPLTISTCYVVARYVSLRISFVLFVLGLGYSEFRCNRIISLSLYHWPRVPWFWVLESWVGLESWVHMSPCKCKCSQWPGPWAIGWLGYEAQTSTGTKCSSKDDHVSWFHGKREMGFSVVVVMIIIILVTLHSY